MASNKSDLFDRSPTSVAGLETSERNAADDSSNNSKNITKDVNNGGLHDGMPVPTAATTQAQTLPGHPTRALSPRSAAAAAVEAEHLRYGHIEFENIHESEEDKRRHYLLRKPKVKQWFYKGKLFRSAEGRASARIELFFDLIFVAIIAVLAEAAIEDPSGNGLVRYIITYWAAYMIWSGLRENMNMFWNDDVLQKTFVMWIMILLITYGNNAPYIKDAPSESHGGGAEEGGETAGPATTAGEAATAAGEVGHAAIRLLKRADSEGAIHHYVGGGRTTTILVYIVADVSLVLGRLGYSFYVHQVRRQLRIQSVLTIVPIALYIAAIFTSVGAAIALVVVGLAWEYASWTAVFSPWLKKYMRLEYSSALNIEHEIERHADFFTIVIGEFIYSSISGAPAGLGIDKATGRAALILLSAASLQLMYMFSSGCVTFVHPLRHSGLYAAMWFTLHIPAVAALTLAGDAGAVLITQNTGVAQGVRWFFSAGVGIGVLCIAMLATLEREKDDDILVMRKRHRLIPRYIVGIILLFLPLTDEETLTSTSLTGIVAALLYATLIYETIFGLHRRQTITGKPETGWKRFFPQFVDPELAHRDVHKVDEEMYEDPDVLGGPDR